MDNQITGDTIWVSEETWQEFLLISDYLLGCFCIIDDKCFYFFGSALCFAWRSASSDPSASYPELWRGQGLIETSSPPIKDIAENVLWSFDCAAVV